MALSVLKSVTYLLPVVMLTLQRCKFCDKTGASIGAASSRAECRSISRVASPTESSPSTSAPSGNVSLRTFKLSLCFPGGPGLADARVSLL